MPSWPLSEVCRLWCWPRVRWWSSVARITPSTGEWNQEPRGAGVPQDTRSGEGGSAASDRPRRVVWDGDGLGGEQQEKVLWALSDVNRSDASTEPEGRVPGAGPDSEIGGRSEPFHARRGARPTAVKATRSSL